MKPYVPACLILCLIVLKAQSQLTPSAEILKKAEALQEQKQVLPAIRLLRDIPPGDSNYFESLYNLSNYYYNDSQWSEALRYCRQGSLPYNEYQHNFLNLEGNILDDMKRPEEALAVYAQSIRRYPNYIHPYTNMAMILTNLGRYDSAEKQMRQHLMANPLSANAHYRLGVAVYRQGKIIPAYLSFAASVLIQPDGQFSMNCIDFMNKLAKGDEQMLSVLTQRRQEPDANFALVEQLFLSRAALEEGYNTGTKLNEPLFRQLHMIIEKLEYRDDDKDFWIQFYLPLFKNMLQKKQQDEWLNQMLSGLDAEVVNEYIKRNKKEMDRFRSDCYDYLHMIRLTRRIRQSERTQENIRYFHEDGFHVATGKQQGDKHTGNWEFYYRMGNIKAKGAFDENDKKQGEWIFYYPNGRISSRESYRNDEIHGIARIYDENGTLTKQISYENGRKNGESLEFHYNGQLSTRATFRDDKEWGAYSTYHLNGNQQLQINTKEGNGDGPFTRFYENGRKESEGSMVAGKQDGEFTAYHENGRKQSQGRMSGGQRSGPWKNWYENGQLRSEENYDNGTPTGELTVYHDNGKLNYREVRGKKGLEGEVKFYDRENIHYCTLAYKEGLCTSASYFNKQGELISTSKSRGKELDLEVYSADGTRLKTAHYNDKDQVEGKETTYFGSGRVETESNYKEGVLQGTSVTYHSNGNRKYVASYTDGVKSGPYTSYFAHGQVESEGTMENDEMAGNWLYYDEMGRRTMRISHIKGREDYFRESFYPNGQLEMVFLYRGKIIDSMAQYDTTGKLIQSIKMPPGKGKLDILQINGALFSTGTYMNGQLHGTYVSYFPDGKILSREYYVYGLQDSITEHFTPDGKRMREGRFDKGMKTGTWKYYNEDGILYYQEQYAYGKLEGNRTYFHENGKVDTEVPFANGIRDGWLKYYAEDGSLMYQLKMHDEKVLEYTYLDTKGNLLPPIALKGGNGKIKAYYSNGKPSAEMEYFASELVGAIRHWSPNGTLVLEGNRQHDLLEGLQTKWYSNGNPKSRMYAWHNMYNGQVSNFHPNGKLKSEGQYALDNQHGAWKYYDSEGKLLRTELYYYSRLLQITRP